jgi:hypothetical protein
MKDREVSIAGLEQALGTCLPSRYRKRLATADPAEVAANSRCGAPSVRVIPDSTHGVAV